MSLNSLASYPNSRVKPRQATSETSVQRVEVNSSTNPNTQILANDPDRTYVVLFNPSGDDIVYQYFDNTDILTQGFTLKAGCSIDLEAKGEVYARSTTGNTVTVHMDIGRG